MNKVFYIHFPHDVDTKLLVANMMIQESVVDELVEKLNKLNVVAYKSESDVSMYHHVAIKDFKPVHETILHMLVSEYEHFYVEEY
jgi:hypothetical protein